MRSCVALIPLTLMAAGCIRGGFNKPAPGARDSGPKALDTIIVLPDLPVPDMRLSNINEPCKPPSCVPGLTCTWKDKTRFCRPPCKHDARVCADGQACGRPTLGTKTSDPTAPFVCMPTAGAAKIFESCKYLPCEHGLLCIQGDLEPVCLSQCDKDADCGPGESCIGSTSKGQKLCATRCTSDAQCKGKTHCVGLGDQMKDHCLPNTPKKAGQSCVKAFCGPGLRCFGWPGQKRICRETCPSASSCAAGLSCLEVQSAGTFLCVKKCGPLDSPVKCAAGEVCYAHAGIMESFCMPGTGHATTCTSTPCVSGKLCINGTCRMACDDVHACPVLMKCATLSAGGKTMPWKACVP